MLNEVNFMLKSMEQAEKQKTDEMKVVLKQ